MKKLLNLKNAKILSKSEQKSINGGSGCCTDKCSSDAQCGPMRECFSGPCLGCPTWMCRNKTGSGGIE